MTNDEIKKETNNLYAIIKTAEERLAELKIICPHEKTFIGNYSYRIGNILRAEICEYCGKPIKFI